MRELVWMGSAKGQYDAESTAVLLSHIANVAGNNTKPADFLKHRGRGKAEHPVTERVGVGYLKKVFIDRQL